MEPILHGALSRLSAGEFFNIPDGRGQILAVFDGLVWVTQEGDLRDVFVAAGGTFALDRPGLTVVEALRQTRLAVLAATDEYREADERAVA